MAIIITIAYLLGAGFVAYLVGIVLVVIYEFKLERVYRAKREALARIKRLPISMAVVGAKTFKVEQDYKISIGVLYKRQREILRVLPFFRRAFL